jgi:NADH-quinone oxidoreductase subunit L
MIGTVAIAGIPPFAGFFSKDEILLQAFLKNKLVYGLAAFAALMTAFYMFRLMSLTFFGAYRGPAWETAGHGGAHGTAGAAHAHAAADDAGHGGHGGHGAWHGPHDAPKAMTFALVVLAVGAVAAGFVGVPAALGGGNAIEHFLHPSFAAPSLEAHSGAATEGKPAVASPSLEAHSGAATKGKPAAPEATAAPAAAAATHEGSVNAEASAEAGEAAALSHMGELALMGFSVLIGIVGIAVAYRFYVRRPEIAANLKARLAGPHRVLTNKYYVDELYDATVINGTMASANGLWTFDRTVVDGAVNGTGWLTIFASWFSHIIDKYVVDGLVNLVGSILQESSFVFRRLQTGLIQNYALLMLFGVFAFVSLYLVLGK